MNNVRKIVKQYCKEDGIPYRSTGIENVLKSFDQVDWFVLFDALGIQDERSPSEQALYELASMEFFRIEKERGKA